MPDPHAGLVRLQDGAGEQAGADQVRLPGEGLLAVVEHVDERAFADFEAEQIGEQTRKPLERDRLGEAQIDGKSPQVRPERRARFKPRRRRGFELLGAARAHPAIERDAGDIGFDLGNLDAVVGFASKLRLTRYRRPAVLAKRGHDIAFARRIGVQRAMRSGVRLALGLARRLARRLAPLRGRRARIVRGLRWQIQFLSERRIL